MTTVTRDGWGARAATGGPGYLEPGFVQGVALHWPGMSKPVRGIKAVSAALRGWQAYHMEDRGWSDIAYQVAIDQDGNTYTLRGLRTQSGANGDEDTNRRFGAFLLVLAPGEEPSLAMVASVRNLVLEHRALFPNSSLVVGHGDIRPGGTDCPGEAVRELLADGVFEPKRRADRVSRARRAARDLLDTLLTVDPSRKGARSTIPTVRDVLRKLRKADR